MYCLVCKTEAEEDANYCPSCGTFLIPGNPIPNNLVWAILATVCCCPPTGIVAIVYAAQVNGKVAAGDFAGARKASKNAQSWAWVSFGLMAGLIILRISGALLVASLDS